MSTRFIDRLFLKVVCMIFLCVFYLVLLPTTSSSSISMDEQAAKLRNLYTIQEINKENFQFGTYHIEGYVVKSYTCPPCPAGSLCKACMLDNIVVSSEKKFREVYELSDKDLIVFVDNIEQYQVGKKYFMLVQVLDVKSTNQEINNVRMIYHEEIKP